MIYKVTKTETSSSIAYINANIKEEAEEIAMTKDVYWRENQDYDSEFKTEFAKEEELIGKIIDNEK